MLIALISLAQILILNSKYGNNFTLTCKSINYIKVIHEVVGDGLTLELCCKYSWSQ